MCGKAENLRGLWRGKQADTEEWIYGYFAGYFLNERGENTPRILRSNNGDLEEVIPQTLNECTGKRDPNNNLIFEGDIIRLYSRLFDLDVTYVIKWNAEELRFEAEKGNSTSVDIVNNFTFICSHGDVIGNVHDNPELLENGEKRQPRDVERC